MAPMDHTEERAKAYSDVFGRQPPEKELAEKRMCDLEREIGRIPEHRALSVLKALRVNPLLFISSVHTTLMLQEVDFDPKQGAFRMARYWEQRERFFGDRAFDIQVFKSPSRDDYLRYYEKCSKIAADPDSEDVMKNIAREYVESVDEAKVAELDRILAEIPERQKLHLMDAQKKSPSLSASQAHKVLFLRREDFIEKRAARRMIKYWKMKYEIFGPDIAHRNITLDDMKEHKLELELGAMRLMPGTDKSGRSIITNSMRQLSEEGWTIDGMKKVIWYVCHSALEKDSCRRNGIVMLANHKGTSRELFQKLTEYRHAAKSIVLDCLPVKIRAAHHFFEPSAWWQKAAVKIGARVGNMFQQRSFVHLGSNDDNLSKLLRFGMTKSCLPHDLGGAVTFDDWNAWLEESSSRGL